MEEAAWRRWRLTDLLLLLRLEAPLILVALLMIVATTAACPLGFFPHSFFDIDDDDLVAALLVLPVEMCVCSVLYFAMTIVSSPFPTLVVMMLRDVPPLFCH